MMKNKLTKIIALLLLVALSISCDDTSETFTVSEATSPVLSELSITQIELDPVNTNNPALTLNWKEANYGQQAAINYAIQFSKDNAFTAPVTAATVTGRNTVTMSMAELNTAAGNAGLNPFEWKDLFARIVSSLGTQSSNQSNSNIITLKVYPYFNYVFKDYYMVGDATAPGWNNNDNNPALFRDPSDENVFTYTGLFADGGHFKVLETRGLWQPQWGTNDGSSIEVNPGGGNDPERFPTAGASGITGGYYTFTINFATKKFTFEPFDTTGKTSPTSLTLQGSALATNTAMTPLNFDGHIWYISSVRLVPGEVQFTTDSGAVWASNTSFSGIATEGGSSIPVVVEDDYEVWFNDLTGQYILIPLNL